MLPRLAAAVVIGSVMLLAAGTLALRAPLAWVGLVAARRQPAHR